MHKKQMYSTLGMFVEIPFKANEWRVCSLQGLGMHITKLFGPFERFTAHLDRAHQMKNANALRSL